VIRGIVSIVVDLCVMGFLVVVVYWMIELSSSRTTYRRAIRQREQQRAQQQRLYEERPAYRIADDPQTSLFILVSVAEWYLEKGYWTCSKCGFARNDRTWTTCCYGLNSKSCGAPWWQRVNKPPTFTI